MESKLIGYVSNKKIDDLTLKNFFKIFALKKLKECFDNDFDLEEVLSSIDHGRFRFHYNEENIITDFIIWEVYGEDIEVTQLWIHPDYRNGINLSKIRDFFEQLYPKTTMGTWYNSRRKLNRKIFRRN